MSDPTQEIPNARRNHLLQRLCRSDPFNILGNEAALTDFIAPTHEELGNFLATEAYKVKGYLWLGPKQDWPEEKVLCWTGEKWIPLYSDECDDLRRDLGITDEYARPFKDLV